MAVFEQPLNIASAIALKPMMCFILVISIAVKYGLSVIKKTKSLINYHYQLILCY